MTRSSRAKPAAVETVTLNFENGGWSVVDYSVN